MNRKILALIVFLGVVVSILVLDPTLRPDWVSDLWADNTETIAESTDEQPGVEHNLPEATVTSVGLLETGLVPTIGQPAADFALRDLNGNLVQLSTFRGEKNVVVNFWATWCSPCVVEMPDLEEIYQEFGEELIVLGVNIQESEHVVEDFLQNEVAVTYPILFDREGLVTSGYNIFAQPTTLFIDLEGNIAPINKFPGKFGAFTPDELRMRIEEFLAIE